MATTGLAIGEREGPKHWTAPTGFTPGAAASTGLKPGAGFGSTMGLEVNTGAIPGECAITGTTPGARKGPVVRRGGATMRVVHPLIRGMPPGTPDPTEGIGGAQPLDMLEGLTPPEGTGGVALDIIQDTRAKEKDLD